MPRFSAPVPMLICEVMSQAEVKVKVKLTYIILVDILGWPIGHLELVDADLDSLALGIGTRASGEVRRELIRLGVSLTVV